jgi:hypothetical protein
MIDAVEDRLKCRSHIGEIHHPACMRIDRAGDVQLDAKGVTVQSRALVPRLHVRQTMRGLDGERAENLHREALRGFASARARGAAARSARAADRAAIAADREIDRAEVAAAMLAVRLATAAACRAIGRDGGSILPRLLVAAGAEIFVHDVANEGAGPHGADFEQTHLLTGEAHLRDGVVDHHAELGMKKKLKRIAAHNALRGRKNGSGGGLNARAIVLQRICHSNEDHPYFDEIARFSAVQRPVSVARAQQEAGMDARITCEVVRECSAADILDFK